MQCALRVCRRQDASIDRTALSGSDRARKTIRDVSFHPAMFFPIEQDRFVECVGYPNASDRRWPASAWR